MKYLISYDIVDSYTGEVEANSPEQAEALFRDGTYDNSYDDCYNSQTENLKIEWKSL